MNKYFVLREGAEPEGPFPDTEIQRQLQVGELSFTDHVCQEGWSKWEQALRIFPPAENKPSTVAITAKAKVKAPPLIEREPEPVGTVSASAWVCTRCQTVVPITASAPSRRNSTWWSPRRGFNFGSSVSRSMRQVCAYCGSASVVPAGTPRGMKLLNAQGLEVTGRLRPAGFGCLLWIIIGIALLFGLSMCSKAHSQNTERIGGLFFPSPSFPNHVNLSDTMSDCSQTHSKKSLIHSDLSYNLPGIKGAT